MVPFHNLSFEKTAFWVQIQNLPFSLLTVEATLSIGETIGTVIRPKKNGEMKECYNLWVELTLENQFARGGCTRTYKYMVKFILIPCEIPGS